MYRGTNANSTKRDHIGEAIIEGEPPHLKLCQPPCFDRLSLSSNYELALTELAASRDSNIKVTAKFMVDASLLRPHFGMHDFGGIGAGLHLGG